MNRPHVIGTWGCPCAPCRAARPAIDAALAKLDRAEFAPNPHCTVGICRRPATRGPWCAEHYGMNNGD